MRRCGFVSPRRISGAILILAFWARFASAQDLSPRAYIIAPIHSNAVILTYSYYDGSILFAGALPITNSVGRVSVPVFSYFHTMSFLGRSANFTGSLPYGVGNFQGDVNGVPTRAYRSGLVDTAFQFAVNVKGGPAVNAKEFQGWRQKTIVGASVKVVAPTGQYDPAKLINYGTNRWAFKPQAGVSWRKNRWVVDGYGGGWFFTPNHDFFTPAGARMKNIQTEAPIAETESHLSYDVKPRLWASIDGNFWYGGRTSLNGKPALTLQTSSRIGASSSIPLSRHQSVKISYSNGSYVRFGGNFKNVSLAWQYSWLGRPN
jgi:hypothetical protein